MNRYFYVTWYFNVNALVAQILGHICTGMSCHVLVAHFRTGILMQITLRSWAQLYEWQCEMHVCYLQTLSHNTHYDLEIMNTMSKMTFFVNCAWFVKLC